MRTSSSSKRGGDGGRRERRPQQPLVETPGTRHAAATGGKSARSAATNPDAPAGSSRSPRRRRPRLSPGSRAPARAPRPAGAGGPAPRARRCSTESARTPSSRSAWSTRLRTDSVEHPRSRATSGIATPPWRTGRTASARNSGGQGPRPIGRTPSCREHGPSPQVSARFGSLQAVRRAGLAQRSGTPAHRLDARAQRGRPATPARRRRRDDLARRAGLRRRRSRYVGLPKTRLQHVLTAAATNLVRADAWLAGTPFAKTRTSRFAALRPAATAAA